MSAPRTFKLDSPHMTGADVREWESWLVEKFATWHIAYPLQVDGDYDAATRSATATMCRAWGMDSAADAMAEGVTPWLRSKLRADRRSETEAAAFKSAERVEYRRALHARYETNDVASPLAVILDDSWGYHPPVHDGVDLICNPNAPLLAICTGRIVRADAGGWWGKGAPANAALRAKGDGIIVLRCEVTDGQFHPGLNFCYGHAEHAAVKVGDDVKAGDMIGRAGFANAWHTHFMVNARPDAKGVGDRDPLPYVNYARRA